MRRRVEQRLCCDSVRPIEQRDHERSVFISLQNQAPHQVGTSIADKPAPALPASTSLSRLVMRDASDAGSRKGADSSATCRILCTTRWSTGHEHAKVSYTASRECGAG